MVDSAKPIADYSDAEIRDALIACGQSDVPAVTSLTRPILQRKLEKLRNVVQQPICGSAASLPVAVEAISQGESTHTEKPEGYYGVAAAPSEQSLLSPYYTSKEEVLSAIKGSKLKGARFKRFESPQCAEAYSRQNGNLEVETGASVEITDTSPHLSTPEVPLRTEKANNYPSLKQQDHTAFRQLIEAGDTAAFAKSAWENPRHLVTAGDAPEVLQPAFRYNALHCAVRKGQLGVCKELFSIIESDAFWKLLYPDDLENVHQERKSRLVDLYLNVPDKTGETALHLACKHGMEHIVSYLVTFPQLNVAAKNGQGCTPAEAARASSPAVTKRIINTVQEPEVYYVPVLRAVDNSSPPSVGQPLRLTDTHISISPRPLEGGAPSGDVEDVVSQAFAGPMSPSKAAEFYREWRSPSREKERHTNTRRTDSERGLERVGRHIAHQEGVGWSEYWGFLGCYTDLSKDEGMSRLEEYLAKMSSQQSPRIVATMDSHLPTPSACRRPSSSSSSISAACSRAIPCKLFAEEGSMDPEGNGLGRNGAEAGFVGSALPKPGPSLSSTPSLQPSPSSLAPPSSPQPQPVPPTCTSNWATYTSSPPCTQLDVHCHGDLTSSNNVAHLMDSFSALHLGDGAEGTPPDQASVPTTSPHSVHVNDEAVEPPGTTHQLRGVPNEDFISSPSSALPGCSHSPVFLAGSCPTKLDCDVKLALCDAEVDMTKYPHVYQWLTTVKSFSEQEQRSWSTPGSKPASIRPNTGLPLSPLVFSSPPPPQGPSSALSRRTPRTPRVPRTTPVHHLARSSMTPRLIM